MSVGLEHYLAVSALLFGIGLLGVLLRRDLLVVYMSLELMLNAANLALVAFSRFGLVFTTATGFSILNVCDGVR